MKPALGLVGCGYWGKNLLRNFRDLGVLAYVCECDPENQRKAGELAPEVPVLSSFEELLATEVQAVALATPAVTHFELARQALRAGKDVFVEKPLALRLEEGRRLLEEAADRIVMVGHILEYHPACVKLVELVRSGELGSVCYLYSNRLSLGKVRREENILWSFAPHDVAMMNRVVGQLPETVAAFGGAYVHPKNADVTVTNLRYPNGVRGHIHVSWLHPFKEQRFVVVGTQKMAVFDGVAGSLTLYDQRVEWHLGEPVPVRGEGQAVAVEVVEPLRAECEAFIRSVETRQPPLTDGRSGLEVLAVLEAAQESLENRGSVRQVSSDFGVALRS